jgi:hypothetical protein
MCIFQVTLAPTVMQHAPPAFLICRPGHVHAYERTCVLNGPGVCAVSTADGFVHIVAGMAGNDYQVSWANTKCATVAFKLYCNCSHGHTALILFSQIRHQDVPMARLPIVQLRHCRCLRQRHHSHPAVRPPATFNTTNQCQISMHPSPHSLSSRVGFTRAYQQVRHRHRGHCA